MPHQRQFVPTRASAIPPSFVASSQDAVRYSGSVPTVPEIGSNRSLRQGRERHEKLRGSAVVGRGPALSAVPRSAMKAAIASARREIEYAKGPESLLSNEPHRLPLSSLH